MLTLISPYCRIYASVIQASIGSDDVVSPIRRQGIIRTNAGLLSIGLLGTNFSEILTQLQNLSFTKMTIKWKYRLRNDSHPSCLKH